MKVFIWERIDKVSSARHPEGGLVVIAADLEAAVFVFPDSGCC